MAICKCFSGMVATAVAVVLLLPVQHFVPDLYPGAVEVQTLVHSAPPGPLAWIDLAFTHFPPLDIFATVTLLAVVLFTYLCEWIQRKLLERRIVKLNQYLGEKVERLRVWDTQQEQLEATLKMVQNATSEYNLLLYLLLRQHRCLAAHNAPPSNCFFEKGLDDEEVTFPRNQTVDA